ncbi:glycosyltransferase family 4 protein [Listeria grandensis]|uniref:Glycosyltransferase family 4 protein n=1 Tax=Listeria grandensis TaxID=1494963 RepID=A0A7X0Y4B3_9LIST|nr:glycosyltransferase family 4 protein [Listeria grandensis]MBC1936765.1 glycosyltransferase family 4 protein [Listeria grandensis]
MTKLLMGVTSSISLQLLRGQLEYFSKQGYDVHLICSPSGEIDQMLPENITVHNVRMTREISPFSDLLSLLRIIMIYLKVRPDITNVSTPKASLLCMIAAFLTRTPTRIYSVIGLRFETCTGKKRKLLHFIEKLVCKLSTTCLAVSPSLKEVLVEERLASREKIRVLGSGSYNGLDLAEFQLDAAEVARLKKRYVPDNQHKVIGYVGRLTKDKGIDDLVAAFTELAAEHTNLKLLLVGDFEAGDMVSPLTQKRIEEHPHIVKTGFVPKTASYYRLMDVFILPTYREGFGNVILEAAAANVPVITTNVTGAKDAIIPNETGLLVEAGHIADMKKALMTLLEDNELAEKLSENGRMRVGREFRSEIIWQQLDKVYRETEVDKRNVYEMEK